MEELGGGLKRKEKNVLLVIQEVDSDSQWEVLQVNCGDWLVGSTTSRGRLLTRSVHRERPQCRREQRVVQQRWQDQPPLPKSGVLEAGPRTRRLYLTMRPGAVTEWATRGYKRIRGGMMVVGTQEAWRTEYQTRWCFIRPWYQGQPLANRDRGGGLRSASQLGF